MTIELAVYDPGIAYRDQKQFDCGHARINGFVRKSLKQQVSKNLSVAYVLTDPTKNDRFVGFYTIAQHTIPLDALSALQLGSLPRNIPCTRLVMLGVDNAYQGQKLGSMLMKHALTVVKTAAAQIGSFGMYLDADAGAFEFYEKLGFTPLEGDKSPETSPMFLRICVIP